ncbi:MAG TPA: phosphate regulon transcriptional regulatory protein PhoB [Cellvibrionales bacterium]|jgi:two-component system phosphate regulon response regulator PhoB|nr:phosphate regulon transcriptional regulatory protein PhoB [Cellvibrionales bacterium]
MIAYKILIVDDERSIRDMIKVALELVGFHCIEAASAVQAMPIIVDERPDLILLDWMMPEVSGIELLRRLRRESVTQEIPVILLTAKSEEQNTVQALEAGADDYITKPFSARELTARIKSVLRRTEGMSESELISVKGLSLDPVGHRVYVNDNPVSIGPTEFKLLKFFMSHQERAYTRGQLLDQVWGSNVYIEERTVDVHIRRLRKVLTSPKNMDLNLGDYIQTVRGTGYRFSATLVI